MKISELFLPVIKNKKGSASATLIAKEIKSLITNLVSIPATPTNETLGVSIMLALFVFPLVATR